MARNTQGTSILLALATGAAALWYWLQGRMSIEAEQTGDYTWNLVFNVGHGRITFITVNAASDETVSVPFHNYNLQVSTNGGGSIYAAIADGQGNILESMELF